MIVAIRLATGSFLCNVLLRERTCITSSQIWFSKTFIPGFQYCWLPLRCYVYYLVHLKTSYWDGVHRHHLSCHRGQDTKWELLKERSGRSKVSSSLVKSRLESRSVTDYTTPEEPRLRVSGEGGCTVTVWLWPSSDDQQKRGWCGVVREMHFIIV